MTWLAEWLAGWDGEGAEEGSEGGGLEAASAAWGAWRKSPGVSLTISSGAESSSAAEFVQTSARRRVAALPVREPVPIAATVVVAAPDPAAAIEALLAGLSPPQPAPITIDSTSVSVTAMATESASEGWSESAIAWTPESDVEDDELLFAVGYEMLMGR